MCPACTRKNLDNPLSSLGMLWSLMWWRPERQEEIATKGMGCSGAGWKEGNGVMVVDGEPIKPASNLPDQPASHGPDQPASNLPAWQPHQASKP